jgi:hypothetical protein
VQSNFTKAAHRAQQALEDPARCEIYEMIALERDSNSYKVTHRDFLVEPSFLLLDLSKHHGRVGDRISVVAKDDIGLAGVVFTLTAVDGTRIEQGPALEDGDRTGDWIYTATAAVPLGADIFVEARGVDHTGDETVVSASPIVGADA